MKQGIYTVRDTKLDHFGIPWFAPTKAIALRNFSDAANDPNTNLYKHPDDFVLYYIGEYNEETAAVMAADIINLGTARDYQHDHEQST